MSSLACAGAKSESGTVTAHAATDRTGCHDVVRSIDELRGGADDAAVLEFACTLERIVLTYNNADFTLLGEANPAHSAILLLYQDNKPTDMNAADIIRAIANVAATYPAGIGGEMIVP